jgi:hypothetical protein
MKAMEDLYRVLWIIVVLKGLLVLLFGILGLVQWFDFRVTTKALEMVEHNRGLIEYNRAVIEVIDKKHNSESKK